MEKVNLKKRVNLLGKVFLFFNKKYKNAKKQKRKQRKQRKKKKLEILKDRQAHTFIIGKKE